jgi:hypothetical protein
MNMLSCSFCEKEFNSRKKTLYDRHIILCEVVHNSNKNKEDDDEEFIPSNKQMYKIIKELSIQNNKLKEKVNEMEKIIQRGGIMKKVDILEKLNLNPVKPDCLFKDWVKNIIIEEEDIDKLITENISSVINTILSRNIDEDSPIISSDIKKTNIYIFTNTDEIKWIKMENDDFLLLIKMGLFKVDSWLTIALSGVLILLYGATLIKVCRGSKYTFVIKLLILLLLSNIS